VFGRDGAFRFFCWVHVVPRFVGAVFNVNGAWPLCTPELRSQVASGFFDTPAKNSLAIRLSKFSAMIHVKEVAISGGLEEEGP
jgi:hypothetical protein